MVKTVGVKTVWGGVKNEDNVGGGGGTDSGGRGEEW